VISMVGFPEYFDVPTGHIVLQHPLYLKYNTITIGDIDKEAVQNDLSNIMATNDNMGIIWYLSNLIEAKNRLV
jgi:hypothetical protein